MTTRNIVETRSQAESYIRLGQVKVNGRIVKKPGYFVGENSDIELGVKTNYVSRAALKLASVSDTLGLDFKGKTVLDVGSSTGGFTDYALQHGAKKVIAVDVGTNQLHQKLREDSRVELHEKTNILDFRLSIMDSSGRSQSVKTNDPGRHPELDSGSSQKLERSESVTSIINNQKLIINLILIDVSFTSLRNILPHIRDNLSSKDTQIVAMLKPQFEAGKDQLNKGVVKNSAQRREILQRFELWCREKKFVIIKKSDSSVAGEKGNVERFYLLKSE